MSERSAVILDGPLLIYRSSDGKIMQRRRVDLRAVPYIETSSDLEGSPPEHWVFFGGDAWGRTLYLTSREQVETISKAWDEVRKGMGPQGVWIRQIELDPTTVPAREVTPCESS